MKAWFASFDTFPSYKGAATHIKNSLKSLSSVVEDTSLYCIHNPKAPQLESDLTQIDYKPFPNTSSTNYLRTAIGFTEDIYNKLKLEDELQGICIFRDVWSGLPFLDKKGIKTIFEVNALGSIELPYRYPGLTSGFLKELEALEKKCLQNAQAIVCPSKVTKGFLIEKYKIDKKKITVNPNGADPVEKQPKPKYLPEKYIVYFGALQAWQGLDTLIKSLRYLQDYPGIQLIICSSVKEKAFKPYKKLIEKLGVENQVLLFSQKEKEELHAIVQHAIASVAPLKNGERNIVQGCSPIKIIETMACGTPLIASDIPVVRELVGEQEAFLFEAENDLDLSRCMRYILNNPKEASLRSKRATELFKNEFSWERNQESLRSIILNLI